MFLDALNLFSDAQAITADAVSTNVLFLGPTKDSQNRDVGAGKQLYLTIHVDEAFNTLTSLDIDIQTDTVEAMSSVTQILTINIVLADLTLNANFAIPIPRGVELYLRLNYDVQGTDPTTGELTTAIVETLQDNVVYKNASVIQHN